MRARLVSWPLAGLVLVVLGACSSNPFALYRQITVTVTGGGGNGQVVASDPAVQITCQFTAGSSSPSPCSNTFPDAGGGGIFTLDASPAAGSTFGGWSGCSSSSGPVCTLTFAVNTGDTAFAVGARFDLLPSGSHPKAEIRAYNGTLASGVTVTLQTPYDGTQTLGPIGANVQVADSLQVEVGAQFIMSSTIGGKTGSVTCTTTAGIISDPADTVTTGNALVTLFTDVAGTPILSCNGTAWR